MCAKLHNCAFIDQVILTIQSVHSAIFNFLVTPNSYMGSILNVDVIAFKVTIP